MKSCFYIMFFLFISAHAEEETFVPQFNDLSIESNLSNQYEKVELTPPLYSSKNPSLAVCLSALMPGLGNAYLGDFKTAGSIFGSTATFITAGAVSNNDAFANNSFAVAQNTYFYGMYAAYRDARNFNKNFSYSYSMPQESFADLILAPFEWKIIKKPEVWGGVLGSFVLGALVFSLIDDGLTDDEAPALSSSDNSIFPLIAFSVGVGEEAVFRGVLLPAYTELLGPSGGLIASSLLFGAAHIPNGFLLEGRERDRYFKIGIPFITAMGAYMGWMVQKNNSLKESTALHSWYDFIVFLAVYSATSSAVNQKPTFSISHSF
jgi:membrane protease YdiL (CAAX protease family)